MTTNQRLCLVIYQEVAGTWSARGLEHDVASEAHSIGEAVRSLVRLVDAHTSFDLRHRRAPLAAFPPAPQSYWSAFNSGTQLSVAHMGIAQPEGWEIAVAVAHRRPSAARLAPVFSRVAAHA